MCSPSPCPCGSARPRRYYACTCAAAQSFKQVFAAVASHEWHWHALRPHAMRARQPASRGAAPASAMGHCHGMTPRAVRAARRTGRRPRQGRGNRARACASPSYLPACRVHATAWLAQAACMPALLAACLDVGISVRLRATLHVCVPVCLASCTSAARMDYRLIKCSRNCLFVRSALPATRFQATLHAGASI